MRASLATAQRIPHAHASPPFSRLCTQQRLLPRHLLLQVTNWFESAVEKSKVMAKPKPAFLDNFFAGK